MAQPLRVFEDLEFGGVDSRSNPMNEPKNRFLRCLNWVPKQAGYLELRWGYTTVTMSGVSNATIQGIIPYTLWNGTQYILFQQGTAWKQMDANGTVTVTAVHGTNFTSSAKSGFYTFNNRIHVGNGTDQKFYDGTTWRNNGIRALASADVSNTTVTQGTNSTTALAPSSVGGSQPGYQFYAAIYNPNSGHVGNRIIIGSRLLFTNTTSQVNIGNLPNLSSEDSEWQLVIGRTRDGGEVPYVVTDSSGNWMTVASGVTNTTVTSGLVDGNFELPTRNTVIPSQCTMFAVVGDYIWAADPNSPYIRRSGSALDDTQGIFMGQPEQSFAGNDLQTFPTAQSVRGIFEVDLELFVGTQNDCAICTDMSGIPMWRGPWSVGLAGPRAGTKTHHGFFWLSADKELCTFVNGLPTPVSEEYEAAELAQFGDSFLSTVEMSYFRNKGTGKDEIRIEGQKQDGTPYTVIHDFKLVDSRSPYGQGYGSKFLGPLSTVFTSSPVRDGSGKLQVYAGANTGQLYKLYSGANDAGSEYTADGIMLLNPGPSRPQVPFIDWYGDSKLKIGVARKLKVTPDDPTSGFTFDDITADWPPESMQGYEDSFLYRAKLPKPELLHTYVRLQLTSHSADGDLTLNNPPHCPLESYGRVYELIPAEGQDRGR